MSAVAQSLRAAAGLLGRLNEKVGAAGRSIAGVVLALMAAIILVQVVSRYALNNSVAWSEELSKSLMVWTAFLVAPFAYRHGANVSVDLFAEALPMRLQAAMRAAVNMLVIWIVAVFLIESIPFVARGMQSQVATLPLKTGYFYAVLPLSLAAMISTGVEMLLRDVAEVISGQKDIDAPMHISRLEA